MGSGGGGGRGQNTIAYLLSLPGATPTGIEHGERVLHPLYSEYYKGCCTPGVIVRVQISHLVGVCYLHPIWFILYLHPGCNFPGANILCLLILFFSLVARSSDSFTSFLLGSGLTLGLVDPP